MKDFNLEAEERNGYLVSSKMKRVWAVQLDLLSKLLEICKKYNLRIFAAGGTMLGTVRDHGYIPWDDDIDMMMPRKDYMKLIEIGEKEFTHPYFLQSGYNEDKFPQLHLKLRNSETTAIRPLEIFCDFNQGIFIDIFALDSIPESEKTLNELVAQRETTYNSFIRPYAYGRRLYKTLGDTINYIKSMFYFSHHSYRKSYIWAESLFSQFDWNKSGKVACLNMIVYPLKKLIRKKEWYQDVVLLPFENIMMPVPAKYDEILSARYGDYMKPAKAPSLHGTIVFDTERPYTEVIKELRSRQPWYRKLMKAPDTNMKYNE